MSQKFKPLGIDERIRQQFTTRVEVYPMDRFGRRVGKGIVKDNDMILDNFGKFYACVLHQYGKGSAAVSVVLKNTAGTDKTLYVIYSGVARYSNPGPNGISVGVGTGSTAAERTNVNLEAITGAFTAGAGAVWTSASGILSWASAIWLAAGATVTECATLWAARESTNNMANFLMFHDVFAGVVIAANHFCHVGYYLAM